MFDSFSSIFCQSNCLLVCLEPVLEQPETRYHYLRDSGQSNLPACSCFIELDKYNMWLSHYLQQSSPISPGGRGLGALELSSRSAVEPDSSHGSISTSIHRIWDEMRWATYVWFFQIENEIIKGRLFRLGQLLGFSLLIRKKRKLKLSNSKNVSKCWN